MVCILCIDAGWYLERGGDESDGKQTMLKVKLPDGSREHFVRHFGTPTDGQGNFQPSLTERLYLANGGSIGAFVSPVKGTLAERLITSKEPIGQRVDRLYLSVLSRPPKENERARVAELLNASKSPSEAIPDVIWALLNSAEFRLNH